METVVFDQTPLAEYLRGEGGNEPTTWVPAITRSSSTADLSAGDDVDADDTPGSPFPVTPTPDQKHQSHQQQPRQRIETKDDNQNVVHTPPPSPPSPIFAPVGRPMVRKRFRNKIPNPLRVDVRRNTSLSSSLNNRYSRAVASTISRVDNAQFIEKFRYTIITSHLLGAATLGQHQQPTRPGSSSGDFSGDPDDRATLPAQDNLDVRLPTATGIVVAVTSAFGLSWAVRWVYLGGIAHLTKKRFVFGLVFVATAVFVGHAYIRQQWLRYIRQSALVEVRSFVAKSHDFDSAASASIAFIKEVELVSRGYRISAPLPPISRMDDRSQSRRCMRLRKVVRSSLVDALPKYIQSAGVMKGFAEQTELEMHYHIHDITDFDISDAMQGFSEAEFDDADSIRTLTVLTSRFHTIRKLFLCALLALEARGDESDYLRWTTAVEGLRTLNEVTISGYQRMRSILGEAETFPHIATPTAPLSPGRERWRSQLGKLNSLSTGIRGLQAKLALLREESDRSLNEADDITQLGPNLLAQYDSIGQDLKLLTQAWEEGRSALASGIDRNEKRLSSISGLLSPTASLSGLTTVGEDSIDSGGGTAEDALRALTGGSPLGGSTVGDPDEEVVFEAVSLPPSSRRRSMLTREERIAKMKEDREKRAEAREQADANRGMLRELEMVINLRPKGGRDSTGPMPKSDVDRNSL
ncbi:proliferating cell nuclear antigen [Sporothrix brasiliensis 5110]|uniref:Vezatin n=1 Tax=Sporothrix brasiliensis 5110 TaxID=1398154 RepID=A0A0C2F6S9_9PEZI|nr:proliferating cell nuclear antigen [Sporothrix brasiliensis 5110]KIH86728.1 proliferating cell nuclear antigen [Sporothrix brasiliensis 5110]